MNPGLIIFYYQPLKVWNCADMLSQQPNNHNPGLKKKLAMLTHANWYHHIAYPLIFPRRRGVTDLQLLPYHLPRGLQTSA